MLIQNPVALIMNKVSLHTANVFVKEMVEEFGHFYNFVKMKCRYLH